MGKLLANLKNTDRRISYYIDKSTITEKRGNPIFFFFLLYLVMTRACVLLSILLANNRAWPQSPPFMAASSASYQTGTHIRLHDILIK